jgi:hypothetical protein
MTTVKGGALGSQRHLFRCKNSSVSFVDGKKKDYVESSNRFRVSTTLTNFSDNICINCGTTNDTKEFGDYQAMIWKDDDNGLQKPCQYVPIVEPLESKSWTVYLSKNDQCSYRNDDSFSDPKNILQQLFSFRLVRNSEPQSALYLHGEEIFDIMEAIWEGTMVASFTIYALQHPERSIHHFCKCVHVTNLQRSNIRTIIYGMMLQLAYSSTMDESQYDAM